MLNQQLPKAAQVIDRIQESATIFTLRLELSTVAKGHAFEFLPGQFNMLYLYGVGEIPVSIVSDPLDDHLLDHTIRTVGRVTRGFAGVKVGEEIGLRGPFGRGWPILEAKGKDVLVITGGLGCAPVVSVINYILRRRNEYRRLIIVQGVKHAADLIWRERYEKWMKESGVEVHIAADVAGKNWPWHVGRVTQMCDMIRIDPANTSVMMCGPEPMIKASIDCMLEHGVGEDAIWLSMERNMQCAVGLCGHCQLGNQFVCKQGPVFNYTEIAPYLSVPHL